MPSKFIVSPLNDEKFITTKKVGDKDLIINTSIENAKDVNRIGVVVSLPLNYEGNIMVGDHVVVQHNVFRTYFDGQGLTRESDAHIKDNLFQVLPELIYLIIRGKETISVDNYVFVSPIIIDKKWVGKEELQHVGIVKYSNATLEANGVKAGDEIAFKVDSEYEFLINGEKLYRMRTSSILAKLN
jgi:co-chaperonin GroES (HSP10)